LVSVNGGTLLITNSGGTGVLKVRWGTNQLVSGLLAADVCLLTNSQGWFDFQGGTFLAGSILCSNGLVFKAGNGTSPATLQLNAGTNVFANGLQVPASATLAGNGVIIGALTIQPGGTLAPGNPIGTFSLSNSPALQG